jgi:N utilization substance protein A
MSGGEFGENFKGDCMADNNNELVARLFAQEIPELAAGKIEIKAIARKPGYRCKLAMYSQDPGVDPIGACVGLHGFHIKNIVKALDWERIDLVRWHDSPQQLIANALQPAAIEKIALHLKQHRAVVVVKSDQVSLVYGRRGENRELASQLCGWQIDVEELPV